MKKKNWIKNCGNTYIKIDDNYLLFVILRTMGYVLYSEKHYICGHFLIYMYIYIYSHTCQSICLCWHMWCVSNTVISMNICTFTQMSGIFKLHQHLKKGCKSQSGVTHRSIIWRYSKVECTVHTHKSHFIDNYDWPLRHRLTLSVRHNWPSKIRVRQT